MLTAQELDVVDFEAERRERRKEQWRRYAEKKRAGMSAEERAERSRIERERYHSKKHDPEFAKKLRNRNRANYWINGYDKDAKAAADSLRNSREDVKSRRRELQRARYARLKETPAYEELLAENKRRYRKHYAENKAYYHAKGVQRARRLRYTFGLLPKDYQEKITSIYERARFLTEITGVPHEVDHIEPLRGKSTSGLHVHWNLQILRADENRSKGNRRIAA